MARNIRVRGIKRKQIDEDKLALAFLLLAKILHEQDQSDGTSEPVPSAPPEANTHDEPEAA